MHASTYSLLLTEGMAMWEVSTNGGGTTSWYSDNSVFPYSIYPVTSRGGAYNEASAAGTFSFKVNNGAPLVTISWRTSIVVD